MPCSRPAGIRPSTGQHDRRFGRAGPVVWPRCSRGYEVAHERVRGVHRNGGRDIGVAERPHAAAPQLRLELVAEARDGGAAGRRVPWFVGLVVGVVRAVAGAPVPVRGSGGCPGRCRSASGRPARPGRRPERRPGTRAVRPSTDGSTARSTRAPLVPGGSAARASRGRWPAARRTCREASSREKRSTSGSSVTGSTVATLSGTYSLRPFQATKVASAGRLGRALLDHLDRDRHGSEGVGGAQPPPGHRRP